MKTHARAKSAYPLALFNLHTVSTLAVSAVMGLLLSGCFGGGQPGRLTEQYALEYTPCVTEGVVMLPETITVERFSAAQQYNSTAMVYQEQPYQRNQYLYHRWRVNPADLVSDYLLRDLRGAGMFRGVFNHRSSEPSRYLLAGDIVEFREYEDDCRRAVVSLNVTLLDTARSALPDRILFQKNYRIAEPIDEKSPTGLARGMSQAVAKVSGLLLGDIFKVVRAASENEGK